MDAGSKVFLAGLFFFLAWYFYQDIGDIPLAQLTLNQLGSNIPSLLFFCIGFAAWMSVD